MVDVISHNVYNKIMVNFELKTVSWQELRKRVKGKGGCEDGIIF